MSASSVRFESVEAWRHEAERRFGADPQKWRFTCPSCGHEWAVRDWIDAGVREGCVAFSCVGRWLDDKGSVGKIFERGRKNGCDYAGGGLFTINPVEIDGKKDRVFAFAPSTALVVAGAAP